MAALYFRQSAIAISSSKPKILLLVFLVRLGKTVYVDTLKKENFIFPPMVL